MTDKIITDSECCSLKQISIAHSRPFYKPNEHMTIICEPYVLCLSSKCNNDNSWKRYSGINEENKGGVSFSVPIQQYKAMYSKTDDVYFPAIRLVGMIYGKDVLKKYFVNNIAFLKQRSISADVIVHIMENILPLLSLMVKDYGTDDIDYMEDEVRMVFYFPTDMKYREMLTPGVSEQRDEKRYVKVDLEKFEEIIISRDCKLTKADIKKLMEPINPEAVIIASSDLKKTP